MYMQRYHHICIHDSLVLKYVVECSNNDWTPTSLEASSTERYCDFSTNKENCIETSDPRTVSGGLGTSLYSNESNH